MVADDPESFADLDGHSRYANDYYNGGCVLCATEQNTADANTPPPQTTPSPPQYTTVTYDVHGADASAAMAAANSSSASGCAGRAGCTTSHFSYTYDNTGAIQGNSATLTATNVTVTVSVTVSLPNWVEYKNASPSEQKAWDAKIAKLTTHEEGHVAINRAGAKEIKSAIQGTTATGSGKSPRQAVTRARANLQAGVRGKFDAALAAINRRNNAYDVSTNNGLN